MGSTLLASDLADPIPQICVVSSNSSKWSLGTYQCHFSCIHLSNRDVYQEVNAGRA